MFQYIYSLVAKDTFGVQSPLLLLDIILCTGCSGNGQCDYTKPRTLASVTEGFSIAECTCDSYHEGMFRIAKQI